MGYDRGSIEQSESSAYSFDRAWSHVDKARGWLTRAEAELLYRLAAMAGDVGRVVELGSYCGRSSIALAAGATAFSGKLLCVDHFGGSPEHRPGSRYFNAGNLVGGVVNTYPEFQKNIEQAGLMDHLEVMKVSTLDAATRYLGKVGLIFIDADHNYDAVREDVRAWSPAVAQGGLIVLHDVGEWSGPTRVAADLLDSGYRRYARAGTTLALCRRDSQVSSNVPRLR